MPPNGDHPHVVDVRDVRDFWEQNPLWSGVGREPPGTPGFFAEHEAMTVWEHGGQLRREFFVAVRRGTRVLDVGCGIGFWTRHFARRGARVTACDITARGVELTRTRLALDGLRSALCVANAEELPFTSGSFDHVNCQGVIHHTPDTDRCVAEFARVLRPGGTFCFSVYYRNLLLRHPVLLRLAVRLLQPFVRIRGRGRENMLSASDPDELVRMYDGVANPLGKSYTRAQALALTSGRFVVDRMFRFGLPRRALPIRFSDHAFTLLSGRFGLMLGLSGHKD